VAQCRITRQPSLMQENRRAACIHDGMGASKPTTNWVRRRRPFSSKGRTAPPEKIPMTTNSFARATLALLSVPPPAPPVRDPVVGRGQGAITAGS
jgi:hypothetical protein